MQVEGASAIVFGGASGLGEATARRLHGQYNVLVLPGSFLARTTQAGNPGANYVRIALVPPLAECVEAMQRIMQFASTL